MQTTLFKVKLKTKKRSKKSWEKTTKTFNFIDLFAGIGGFRIALESYGGECVFSSEWDEKSQFTYAANFQETPSGDIKQIKEESVPKHQILCAGFPCQAFSVSGKRMGFEDTRGTLFFDVARIAKHTQPDVLFLENVKNFTKHDGGKTMEVVKKTLDEIGYDYFINVLCSSDYGVPQARERVYFVAFRKDLKISNFTFPKPTEEIKVVKDILEGENSTNHHYIEREDIFLKNKDKKVINPRKPLQIGYINKGGQGERIYSIEGAGITLSAYGGGAASKTGAYLVNGKVRKLSPRECARLQGFPEDYILHENKNTTYRQFGDSVSVPVLKSIFDQIIKAHPKLLKK